MKKSENFQSGNFQSLAQSYRELYRERFNARLRVCNWLRRAAFVPGLADAAIRAAGVSERLRRWLALATRGRRPEVLRGQARFE
jgi:hypothetical protein